MPAPPPSTFALPELLAAVLATPAADGPRRVLADALGERGDPRGELINIQCSLAAAVSGDGEEALRARERELLGAHEPSWREELPRVQGVVWGPLRRGFVDAVIVSSAADFVAHADAILAAAPITELRLRALKEGDHALLAACPALAAIPRLRLHNVWATPALLGAEVLADLVELELVNARPRDAGTTLFAREFSRLEALGLDCQYIRAAGARALGAATQRWPTPLRSLDLRRNALDDEGLDALVESARLDGLERLVLAENELHVDALTRLAERLVPGQLRELDLRCNPIGDAGAKLIASHPAFSGLTRLELGACRIHDLGAAALAQSSQLAGLTAAGRLGLSCNYIQVAGMIELMEAGFLAELEFNEIEDWDNQLIVPLAEEPCVERSYIFSGEDHYCWSGQRHDGRKTLVFVDDDIELFDFDAEGRPLGHQTLPSPAFERPPEHSYEPFNRLELLEHLFIAADFNPCELELRELPGDRDMSLDVFNSTMIEWVIGEDECFDDTTRAEIPQQAREWIASGEYVVWYGDPRWCHDHGACHTT